MPRVHVETDLTTHHTCSRTWGAWFITITTLFVVNACTFSRAPVDTDTAAEPGRSSSSSTTGTGFETQFTSDGETTTSSGHAGSVRSGAGSGVLSTGRRTSDSKGSSSDGALSTSYGSSGEDFGCDHLDVLFVIDNSATMWEAQQRILGALPGFLDDLRLAADEPDLHIGVITTDVYQANTLECSRLGGLVVRTGGLDSSNASCGPYASGTNYMTNADDLESALTCAAAVGSNGDPLERPMEALLAAIGPELAREGACNEGFLRDDAKLLLLVFTDEYDGPSDPELGGSTGTPQTWHQAVLDAKSGVAADIVTAVFTNFAAGSCPPSGPFDDGTNLVSFAELFGRQGVTFGICEEDFSANLGEVAQRVEGACSP